MKFDDILEHHVGEFGPYQKRIYILVCLPAIAASIMSMMPVFLLAQPEHRCKILDMSNDTFKSQSEDHERQINISIPMEYNIFGDYKRSQCQLYDHGNSSLNNVLEPNGNTSKKYCNDWVFDDSLYDTAVNDFKMVCNDAILQSHFKMITFFGALVGAFINGVLSDLFGRKRIFLICLGIYMVATIVLIFSAVFEVFLAMRFVQGVAGSGVFMISFVFVMELVGPHYRMFAGIFIEIFWCIGLFILVAAAYFIKKWTYLMLVLSTPCVALFSYIWLIPESPRWLMSTGRIKEAEKILQRTAKANGTTLPEKLLEQAMKEEKKLQETRKEAGQVWKLFLHKTLLIRTLIIVFNRFCLNTAYYGISLNVEHLSGNLYLNYTLSSAVETAAAIVILLLINKLGRKPLYCGSMVIGALGFLTSAFPIFFGTEEDLVYSVSLVMVGKFGTSAAFDVMYVYGSEIFPTSLRNSAMGFSLVIELMGGVVSPYIVDAGYLMSEKLGSAFPMLVFGALLLVAGFLSLLLPETRNRKLPENLEDALKFGKHEVL